MFSSLKNICSSDFGFEYYTFVAYPGENSCFHGKIPGIRHSLEQVRKSPPLPEKSLGTAAAIPPGCQCVPNSAKTSMPMGNRVLGSLWEID